MVKVSEKDIPLLTDLMQDEYESIRRAAIRLAGELKQHSGRLVPVLLDALKDEGWRVRSCAKWALLSVSPEDLPLEGQARSDEEEAEHGLSPETGDALYRILTDYSRIASGEGLSQDEIENLMEFLAYQDIDVRDALVAFLTQAGSAAVKRLRKHLSDERALARMTAARALGRIRAKEAVPDLINTVRDEDWFVRSYAIETLGILGPDAAEAVPALSDLLQSDDVSRGVAAWALGKIGSQKAVPVLQKATHDSNPAVASTAEKALRAIQSPEA